MRLVGEGMDPCMEINRTYSIRLCKSRGHVQFHVNGVFSHACVDWDAAEYPVPDHGKFGFRLIGSNVMADITKFRVYAIEPDADVWLNKKARPRF
jgi:hypothetical protein